MLTTQPEGMSKSIPCRRQHRAAPSCVDTLVGRGAGATVAEIDGS
jgi:hypothetical protein